MGTKWIIVVFFNATVSKRDYFCTVDHLIVQTQSVTNTRAKTNKNLYRLSDFKIACAHELGLQNHI